MRVALYARISTKPTLQVDKRLLELRQFCKESNWKTIAEYIDKENKGKTDPPAFNRLFKDARQEKFDLVLFWSLDSFSREGSQKTVQHLQQLEEYGIKFKSYTEEYLDSTGPFRDVLTSLLTTLAQQERIQLSDRVKAGLERAKKEGRVGGRPGLTPSQVRKIRQMKKRHLSDRAIGRELGISHRTVAKYLQEK